MLHRTATDFAAHYFTGFSRCWRFGVEFGQLHYRSLEIDKVSALKTSGSNYNAVIELGPRSINDLNWWIGNISLASKSIVKSHPSYIIKSDTPTLEWGAVLDSRVIGGRWTVSESSSRINYLELLAAFFALKAFCLNSQRCTVQLQLDNSTAVIYVNYMGGTKSLALNELTIQMWGWSMEHSMWISAVHIAGASNHSWYLIKSRACFTTNMNIYQMCPVLGQL